MVSTIRRANAGAALLAVIAAGVLTSACGAAGRSPAAAASAAKSGDEASSAAIAPTAVALAPAVVAASTSAAAPARTPCTTNERAKYVFVSLRRQHMWMCARHRVVRSTAITSGMVGQYTQTPTGTYAVQGLNRNTVLTLNTGATYPVKYWIPFDAPLFGFHDSSWQDFPYGSSKYRTAGSHGCVHVPLAAIKFLYNWAGIGTTVRIKS